MDPEIIAKEPAGCGKPRDKLLTDVHLFCAYKMTFFSGLVVIWLFAS